MSSAHTLTIDLPLVGEPPPLPALVRRSRHRRATPASGTRIGAWRVERELGRGGMAAVYAVVHTRFGKRAALKLAHRSVLGPRFTPATFLREARMANLIDHAGVAEVFATGTYDGRPYLAMERLVGRSLGARLDDGPLPREEAIAILIELCEVLAAAHAAGVTHRDLKLDNVFLLDEPDRGDRRVKLLDWGMARVAGEDDPLRGMIAGTLTYVAPEQVRGDDITPAADVYALAVVAYQLLLGEPPFTATSDLELIHKHLRDEPPRPRTLWRAIPPALEQVLLAMLAKQPADRPSLGDFVRALGAVRPPLAISVRRWLDPPPPAPDVFGRPAVGLLATRRQRMVSAALGLMITVAAVVQAISS
ncbi:MAG TPA: serine/threonine-protein kinase [Kofleriaceae bacterium]|nr:serine/threonine-protein kinase [Kofleriaceae bacterium]